MDLSYLGIHLQVLLYLDHLNDLNKVTPQDLEDNKCKFIYACLIAASSDSPNLYKSISGWLSEMQADFDL